MNISDVIEALQEIQNVHGDIKVTTEGRYVDDVVLLVCVDGPFADIRTMACKGFYDPSPLMPTQVSLH